jgi:hypothetical protein
MLMLHQGRSIMRSLAAACVLLALVVPAQARTPAPFQARGGLDIAMAAAQSWSPDAFLVYVENDEDVDERGTAGRWGYLFYSPGLQKARGYSVRDGRVLLAENLMMKFEAPRLGPTWIDSGAALAAAERGAGAEFRRKFQGRLSTMLLLRGAVVEKEPDQTTWMLVYTSPTAPSLFVVIDAADGKVRRTWRG